MPYTLTVYREDDTTPWFEVSTDPAHPNPYLHEPGEIDHGEVDFLRGTATIGQVNLRVIDPQTGASQSERWLTERLGVPAGQPGAGHTALIGRRALLRRDDTTTIIDGVVYSVALAETFAGFTLEIRDIRERARKTKLFTRTGTATILPRGVLHGYGRLPDGRFLVPPTAPLTATFFVEPGMARFDLSRYWQGGRPLYGPDATVPPELVFTDHMAAATVVDVTGRYVNVRLLWRVAGTATWNVLDSPLGLRDIPLLNAWPAKLRDAGPRNGEQVQGILSIILAPGQAPLPDDGDQVEVLLVYTGPATEHYPFHFEGTAGELLTNIYDGLYSPRDADGNVIPTGVRYDEAAVLALTTPVRLRITEPVDDAREWTERFIYRAVGAAPALDSQGRISPVRAAFPDPDAILPELTDENAQPVPGWEHPGQDAVTVVRVTYPRDYRVSAASDPLGERSDGDGIASRSITIEHRAPDWAIGLMGERPHEIDGVIFRALGGVDGESITGDVTDETGAQVAAQRAIETLDRWLFGGQISTCRILAAAFPGLRVGDWVIDSRSWRPNYATGKRGGPRLAQVMSVRELNPAWLEVTLVDAGPAEQPVQPPTLGALSVDDDGVVSVPVIAVPAGGEAAVYYAVSATQPPSDSPLWTFLGRTAMPATLTTPALPAGATVWVRARGEAAGRRPSPYTAALSIVTPSTPRVHGVRVGVVDSVATVAWTPNAQTLGVRVYYAAHAPDVEPTLIDSLDVAAAVGSVVLPLRIEIGQSVTVEVEPWTGWTGSAVSGTPGSRVRAAATYDPERREPRATIRIVSTTRTSETLEYQGRLGPLGRGPLEYRRRIDRPRIDGTGAEGPWGPGPGDGWVALPTPPPQEVVTRAKFWPRTVVLQVRDADLQVAEARHTIAPELPALDPNDGTIDRSVPFNDGQYAVIAEDPSGERIAENVQDASGRPVRSFFAKPSPEQPDTADSIPDGTTKRVTTIDEAAGGGRAFQGLLPDGTVGPGKIRRDLPFADGKYAVVSGDPSGQVLDPAVTDADGREVRRFFAKSSADDPDTADAIPDGTVKRVTTIDEAAGGGRAFQGLLADGTVAPGKVVAASIQDGAVIRQKIATGAVAAEHIQAGAISDAHYSGSPADKLATVKVRFPPTVEVVANEAVCQVQRDITVTIRDPDNGRVRFWWRVVTTPSDSYTTPAPTSSGALQAQPYTATVRVDRAAVDSFFEFWGEDEDGGRSAIVRVPIPPLENPASLMDPPTIMTTIGSTCPSQLVDILTWTFAGGLPPGWRVEVWIIEGTQTGNPFAGVRLSSNASPPFQTVRLQNVRSAVGTQYQRTYGLRLVNSHGIVVDEDTNGRADGYATCPT